MVKIKTKKQLNLPQLIEWAWDNDVREEWFYSYSQAQKSSYGIEFDEDGDFISRVALNSDLLFTVEVEEEIKEDTVIPELVELYEDTLHSSDGSKVMLVNKNTSISRAKDVDECPTLAFYIINDDLTLDLIWTLEKGLVK